MRTVRLLRITCSPPRSRRVEGGPGIYAYEQQTKRPVASDGVGCDACWATVCVLPGWIQVR